MISLQGPIAFLLQEYEHEQTDLLNLLENMFDQKRTSANPNPKTFCLYLAVFVYRLNFCCFVLLVSAPQLQTFRTNFSSRWFIGTVDRQSTRSTSPTCFTMSIDYAPFPCFVLHYQSYHTPSSLILSKTHAILFFKLRPRTFWRGICSAS